MLDVFGNHAFVCLCRQDRTKRYTALRIQSFFGAQAAYMAGAELERLVPPAALSRRAPPRGEEQSGRPLPAMLALMGDGCLGFRCHVLDAR